MERRRGVKSRWRIARFAVVVKVAGQYSLDVKRSIFVSKIHE